MFLDVMRHIAKVSCLVFAAHAAVAGTVDFVRDIQPVLEARCVGCHGGRVESSGLRLDNRERALRGGYSGRVIQPGDADASRLYRLITLGIEVGGKRISMPPTGPLPGQEVELLRRWIQEGAVWPAEADPATHPSGRRSLPWSFAPIRKPPVPPVRESGWVRNPVDAFILAKLEASGLSPSSEASKATLVRRLYLDIVGLPPTPEETRTFLADARPDAYERLVDQLMRSPHYGEKWARPWLDVARYADSEGGVQDYPRPFAWRYRQWVIEALNQDMPFDEFTVDQLAGDLLPHSTLDQRIATGFLRNTITSREGGIDLNKLRFDQLVDRTNTVGAAWLGLTFGCAQCHDHKYDPITQKDYYRLMAFFENGIELDLEVPLPGELGPYRHHVGQYKAERAKLLDQYGVAPLQADWETQLRDAAAHPGKHTEWDGRYDAFSKLVDNGLQILQTSPDRRSERAKESVTNFFLKTAEGYLRKEKYQQLQIKQLYTKLTELSEKYPPLSLVMTLAEGADRKPSFVRIRGNYLDKGVEVTAGTPESLPPLPARNADRLALARWLVAPENPLTARVAVNRFWQELFGRGLVRTAEDFGMEGEKPTHPELLDWLAASFRENQWSMKAIQRMILTSATYRQSSWVRPDLIARDPDNTLLARQSRLRLPAELIRDSSLAASGLLLLTVGGESIRPPQPDGVADLSYSFKWEQTSGANAYRRGVYVHVQRTALYPLLMNFDAPDRTVTCARREISNTPLQALNLMNDPVFAEAAQALAARILKEARDDPSRIDRAFEVCYSRVPNPNERDLVASYLALRKELARQNPKSPISMSIADLEGVDQAEAAAWYGMSRALLNSDEFLNRE